MVGLDKVSTNEPPSEVERKNMRLFYVAVAGREYLTISESVPTAVDMAKKVFPTADESGRTIIAEVPAGLVGHSIISMARLERFRDFLSVDSQWLEEQMSGVKLVFDKIGMSIAKQDGWEICADSAHYSCASFKDAITYILNNVLTSVHAEYRHAILEALINQNIQPIMKFVCEPNKV